MATNAFMPPPRPRPRAAPRTVPGHHVLVRQTPPENIKSAAHSRLDLPEPHLADAVQVRQAPHPACVSHREGALLPQDRHEFVLNAQLHALHVDAMHEEFVGALREAPKSLRAHLQGAEALPSVSHNEVLPLALPAAQVQHEFVSPDRPHQRAEPLLAELAPLEHMGGDYHMACARIQVLGSVFCGHSAPNLQPAGVGPQRLECRVSTRAIGSQHDNVPPRKAVPRVPGTQPPDVSPQGKPTGGEKGEGAP